MTTGGLFLYLYLTDGLILIFQSMSLSSLFGAHQEVGRLVRHHGCEGEMLLLSPTPLSDSLEDLEVLFVWIDQLPVPFYIESLRFTGDSSAIVQFQESTSRETSARLIGCEVTCLAGQMDETALPQGMESLIGFIVTDPSGAPVGPVEEVFDFKGNFVLEVRHDNRLVRLPFHPDLVLDFDEKHRKLKMTIAEGLLDS